MRCLVRKSGAYVWQEVLGGVGPCKPARGGRVVPAGEIRLVLRQLAAAGGFVLR